MVALFALASLATLATRSATCTGTISSLTDVSAAVMCKTVNINAFTVPAGETFRLDLLDGTTVNVLGDIEFGNVSWAGPLFEVKGTNIIFNGNGKRWDGGGPFYWDGGANIVTRPVPMMKIEISGKLSNVYAVNSPSRCFAVSNPDSLTITSVTVDNSQGNYPNAKSSGKPAGHNTDGFDVSGNDVVIQNCTVINQDDCMTINKGSNILFKNNYCGFGHGISIGSITSNVIVDGVTIQGNTVVNSQQAFRIKTRKDATNSRVSNVIYNGNTATNCSDFGVLITQSYPEALGTPGDGVTISNVKFYPETTTLTADSSAYRVAVNCGASSCTGTWNWAGLEASGGEVGPLNNVDDCLSGYAQ
ncbi:pectin lyase fold/virulence factor [Melanogaster broomeanus]|nr:pectin lyase fold/virulence factor [Melanogaster broomeanus]